MIVCLCIASLWIPTTAQPPSTQPDDGQQEAAMQSFQAVSNILNVPGTIHDGVLTFTLPRKDLEGRLFNDLGDIPIAAGIESRLDFFFCPCGKTNVIGQFIVTEVESNDVIDALRKSAYMKVVSVSPMMMGEKPRLLVMRIQGDGQAESLAGTLRHALNQIGTPEPTTQP